MKRIICLIFSIVFMLSAYSVFASGELKINTVFDGEEESLYVSGTIDTERKNVPVILKISKDNKLIGAQQITANEIKDGSLYFNFEPFKFLNDAVSGEYLVYVSASHTDSYAEEKFRYYGVDKLLEIMNDIQKNVAEELYDSLEKLISEKHTELAVDINNFNSLSPEAKNKVLVLLCDETYTVPADCSTQENRLKLMEEVVKFRKSYNDALAIAMFSSIDSINELNDWLELYVSKYSIDKDNIATESINESEIYEYLLKVKSKNSFVDHFSDVYERNIDDIDTLKSVLYEYSLLTIIETEHYTQGKEVIEKFGLFFDIDWAKFNKLSSKIKNSVYTKLAGKSYKNYDEVASAFNRAIEDIEYSGENSGNNSGTSSSWGGSSNSGGQVNFSNNSGVNNAAVVFSDLKEAQWAQESILYLYNKGIVNGISKGVFAPNKTITRAEFVKMALLALNVEIDDSLVSVYEDVSENDWYYDYVITAHNNGYVMGVGNNKFSPDSLIERQNMATVLYRMIGSPQIVDNQLSFVDSYQVSDYAKDAVNYFSCNGIINGTGDGRFNPKGYATRAEVSQLIYNLLNSNILIK